MSNNWAQNIQDEVRQALMDIMVGGTENWETKWPSNCIALNDDTRAEIREFAHLANKINGMEEALRQKITAEMLAHFDFKPAAELALDIYRRAVKFPKSLGIENVELRLDEDWAALLIMDGKTCMAAMRFDLILNDEIPTIRNGETRAQMDAKH